VYEYNPKDPTHGFARQPVTWFELPCLCAAAAALSDSGFRTYKCANETANPELTPNQRISVLAKKWREERNFWIAAMAFTLWW
jgi:hypothetical protein